MTLTVSVAQFQTFDHWRTAARGLLVDGVLPKEVLWQFGKGSDLFADAPMQPTTSTEIHVPKAFLSLARSVVWHSDPERFARLYALLWRVKDAPHLMSDRGDPQLAQLRRMEKAVHRCQHKMKAFVRFREIGQPDAPRRSFAAWFEPTHHTVEPTASFFLRRFADMDWRIITPDKTAVFVDGRLSFEAGQDKPPLPEDATEELWTTYFRNIFNPARIKLNAMQSEMPRKYWKNMPETAAIPDMIAGAEARVRAMAEAAPTLAPARAVKVREQFNQFQSSWDGPADALPKDIAACTRCPLHCHATQAVLGEGPPDAQLMIVGEQPGDMEDLQGRPFVGPAGQQLDHALDAAGIDKSGAYLTNAVKHFKFQAKGRRRLHQRPNMSEIEHCKWWLKAEITQQAPELIVALGATAAHALTGSGKNITKRRGRLEQTTISGTAIPVLITIHPSYLLRLRDPSEIAQQRSAFIENLASAKAQLLNKKCSTSPSLTV